MKINLKSRRMLLALPALALIILIAVVKSQSGPQKKPQQDNAVAVEVASVARHQITPFVLGYGRVHPKETWQAISQVSGRVIFRHVDLEEGKTLPAGTKVLEIDPVDYQLKLAQSRADLASAQAELERLQLEESRLDLSLKIEQQSLALARKELKRQQGLLKRGLVSPSQVDTQRNQVLAQEQQWLEVSNSVKQHPANIEIAQAKIAVYQSRLQEAQRLLDKTQITLPFDARVVKVNAELAQLVSEKETLLEATHLGTMQLPAQVAMTDMRVFARYMLSGHRFDPKRPDISQLNLDADLILYLGSRQFTWQGKVTSVKESIDSKGNTVTLIIDAQPQQGAFDPANRPPLTSEMYLQAKIKGRPQSLLAIPSYALHGNRVYVLSQDKTLEIREVVPAFENEGMTVIYQGLSEGETLVLSDLIPAVPGMALKVLESPL